MHWHDGEISMTIALLPLDSRPCNSSFPEELAGENTTLLLPEIMDDYTRPAPFEASCDFLMDAGARADAFVISADHLVYGSLLASRTFQISETEAIRRADFVREVHKCFPDKPIVLFSIIMRASISALASSDLDAYQAMMDYAEAVNRAQQEGDVWSAVAEHARARIPEDVLETYLSVRKRNHAVNLHWLDLPFSSLLYLQEDARVYGFHRLEQQELIGRAEGRQNVYLHNGADEGGCVALARTLLGGRKIQAHVAWLGPDFIALYEDRLFSENVKDTMRYVGIEEDPDAQTVMVVAPPPDAKQQENDGQVPGTDLDRMADAVNTLLEGKSRVYLLDVIGANGGSLRLMKRIRHPERLWGYSAWNTASNSLGTLAAQLALDALEDTGNTAFRDARLLDDLLYQSLLRDRLNAWVRANGEDPFQLKDRKRAENRLREMYAQNMPYPWVTPHQISLPWARTFEVKIDRGR